RGSDKHMAALGTALAFQQPGAAQRDQELVEEVLGDQLAGSDVAAGDRSRPVVGGKINHRPEAVVAFHGDTHNFIPQLWSLRYGYLGQHDEGTRTFSVNQC